MKALSLFANIGIAEACLREIGIHVAVANEYIPKRAELYQKIYPTAKMICGDITDETIYNQVLSAAKTANIQIVMATPP